MWFYVLAALGWVVTIGGLSTIESRVRARFPRVRKVYLDVGTFVIATAVLVGSIGLYRSGVASAQRTTDAVTRYAEAVHMDPRGHTIPLEEGGVLIQRGPLIDTLDGAWIATKDDIFPACTPVAIAKFEKAATSWPDIPWGHFGLAFCAACAGDQGWRGHAERAAEILRATTLVAGHDPHQDVVLKNLEIWLDTKGNATLHHSSCPSASAAPPPVAATPSKAS